MVKVWAVGRGWDLVKAESRVCLVLCAGLAPPAVELLVAGLALPGLALPGVGWALAAVKAWGQVPLPGCV